MKKTFLVFIFVLATQNSFGMNQDEEEVHNEINHEGQDAYIEHEKLKAKKKFHWQEVAPTSRAVRNYMWKPNYSSHFTENVFDNKAGKSFFQRRIKDGDDLISHIVIQGGFKLFQTFFLDPIIQKIQICFPSRNERILMRLNEKGFQTQTAEVELEDIQKRLSINAKRIQYRQQQLEYCKNQKKRKKLEKRLAELFQTRKILDSDYNQREKEYNKSIRKYRKSLAILVQKTKEEKKKNSSFVIDLDKEREQATHKSTDNGILDNYLEAMEDEEAQEA